MAVKKIPQPLSNKQVQPTFRAPQLQDGMSSIYKGVANIGHKILDQRAQDQGYDQGYKEVSEGTNQKPIKEISNQQSITIRGNAYKKGAQAAFVAEKSTEMITELGNLYNNYVDTGDGEAFQNDAKKYRDNLAKQTPSNIQSLLLPKVDQEIASRTVKLAGKKLQLDINMNVAKQTDRINIITENIANAILLDDGSGDDLFAEAIGIINSLVEQGHIDATNINTYKQLLVVPVFEGEIKKYFQKELTTDAEKLEFLNKVENQGVTFFAEDNEIVEKIQKEYAGALKEILPDFDFNKPSDTQLAKIIAKASTEFAEQQERNTELKKWMAESQLQQITDAWNNPNKTIDQVITKESIVQFGLDQDIDDDVIAGMIRQHDIYSEAELLLIGHEKLGLQQLEDKINAGKEAMDNADDTTEAGLKLYEINSLANAKIAKRMEDIATAYQNEEIYAFFDLMEIKTPDDLIVRRQLLAKKLNMGNPDSLPLFDKKEKEFYTNQINTMSVNDLVNAVGFAEQLGIDLNNPQILTELGLDMAKEAIILMDDNVSKNMMAQADIRYDENIIKLKKINTSDNSGLTVYAELTDALKNTLIDYQSLDSVTLNRVATFLELVAIDKRANIHGMTSKTAIEEAVKMLENVYRLEEFRGQNFLLPASISKENWQTTTDYLEEMLTNPVKYGFVLPQGTATEDFSTDNYAIEYSNGTLSVVLQDSAGGFSGVPVTIKNPQTADNKITVDRLEIKLDSNARQDPNENLNKNKHWDHEITSNVKTILEKPVEIAQQFKDENIVNLQNEIRMIEDEIAKINAGQGPDAIKHALRMGPEQRLTMLQTQLQNVLSQVDGPKDNDDDYEIAYFRISQESNFVDTFTQHITNVPNQQQVISGIMLKNAQEGAEWTEDELLYLSQYTTYEALMDPVVRDYVITNWPAMREQGGFETLRTGYKLTPAGTLYVLMQDAVNGTN